MFLSQHEKLPLFITKRKNGDFYCPIPCFFKRFKLITNIITVEVGIELEAQKIFTEEQTGCDTRTYICIGKLQHSNGTSWNIRTGVIRLEHRIFNSDIYSWNY